MPIDAATRLYCVLGNPVAQSKSPVIHNAAFAAVGINGVYVALAVSDIGAAMAAVRTLNIGGASVTIPHKVSIMAHLDAVDQTARAIGAVNTVVNRDGRLTGHNTDWQGAMDALGEKTAIDGRQVLVLGAGGAARAVAYGIKSRGGHLLVTNRTMTRGERLAGEFGGRAVSQDQAEALAAEGGVDVLINTTSVGMAPAVDACPLSPGCLRSEMTIMDIVYNPLETRLLAAARAAGCIIVDGLSMFVCQGGRQFEHWAGVAAPTAVMREAAWQALA